jgi:hypothetical protein
MVDEISGGINRPSTLRAGAGGATPAPPFTALVET